MSKASAGWCKHEWTDDRNFKDHPKHMCIFQAHDDDVHCCACELELK